MEKKELLAIARRIVERHSPRNFGVVLWDGSQVPASVATPPFTLHVRNLAGLRALCVGPDSLALGEAYVYDDCDVEGNLKEVFPLVDELTARRSSLMQRLKLVGAMWRIPKTSDRQHGARLNGEPQSRDRTRRAINFHYDLPVDFWRLWLDMQLVYSCAYFETPETTLDRAQTAKLDLVCRKLRLKSGERFLDMGCGWGALICHAAKRYGVEALGVTLSPRQAEHAAERIRALGLAGKCRVEVRDFRDINDFGYFDKIASVGAVEHVRDLRSYFETVFRLLKPEGWFLNHGITTSPRRPLRGGASFLDRYVFPDYHLTSIGESVRSAELAGFEVRDVENLREHYALTLEEWLSQLEAHEAEIEKLSDAATFRIFRLYLAGAAHEFRAGRLNLHQTLLLKGGAGVPRAPLTRRDWFAP